MVELLHVFKTATCTLSSVYFPTSHLFIPQAYDIVSILEDSVNNIIFQSVVIHMLQKWLNYYYHILSIYLVASVLDSRVKIDGLMQYLEAYYTIINKMLEYIVLKDNVVDPIEVVEMTKECIRTLYSDYQTQIPHTHAGSSDNSASSSPRNTNSSTSTINIPPSKKILHTLKRSRGGASSTEFDIYLTTSFEFQDDDSQKQVEGNLLFGTGMVG
ncbi:hypothetical protein ACH5RR_008591 [Cinchona calisaya]|uniref:Uncharacterized protein n=1 Tax=Cinchona calisaya TaxID=153742 RepID=A0ABD3AC59_9GENT